MDHWSPLELAPGAAARRRVGPLHLWATRTAWEWSLAWAGNEPGALRWEGPAAETPPPAAARARWAAPDGQTRLRLAPAAPDRGVVVRPGGPLLLPPGVHVRLFLAVPLWVRVVVGEGTTLLEVPTVHLSNTWFGEPGDGELAWALRGELLHDPAELRHGPHEAVCAVEIVHRGATQLDLGRLFLRAAHLGIFRAGERLWTSGVRAVYEGGDRLGSVEYLATPPPEAAGAEPLAPPREQVAAGTLLRARDRLLRSLEINRFRWGGS